MQKLLFSLITILLAGWQLSAQITAPGVKWSDTYSFDRYNEMKIDFFAAGDELKRTYVYKTWYSSTESEVTTTPGGLQVPKGNFSVLMDAPQKDSDIETIFDMTNEVAIQIFGSDAAEPMYNAGGFKFPEGEAIKKLDLVATDESRTIAGHLCKKYTYVYKKIFGSAWITGEVKLPNDYGIFRAAKMAALHNTLSGEGFVMEMTSEDAKGGKTVMTTVALGKSEKRTITLPRNKMGTAMNKVNYFTF